MAPPSADCQRVSGGWLAVSWRSPGGATRDVPGPCPGGRAGDCAAYRRLPDGLSARSRGQWPPHGTASTIWASSPVSLSVANERSGNVTWLDLDNTTGIPQRAGAMSVPAASNIIFG